MDKHAHPPASLEPAVVRPRRAAATESKNACMAIALHEESDE